MAKSSFTDLCIENYFISDNKNDNSTKPNSEPNSEHDSESNPESNLEVFNMQDINNLEQENSNLIKLNAELKLQIDSLNKINSELTLLNNKLTIDNKDLVLRNNRLESNLKEVTYILSSITKSDINTSDDIKQRMALVLNRELRMKQAFPFTSILSKYSK